MCWCNLTKLNSVGNLKVLSKTPHDFGWQNIKNFAFKIILPAHFFRLAWTLLAHDIVVKNLFYLISSMNSMIVGSYPTL